MIKALQEGWIAGAGLDVLETEPVGHNNPLLGMDNVILTAHVASASSRFDQCAQAPRRRRDGAGAVAASGRAPASIPRCWRSPSSSAGSPSRWSAGRGTRGWTKTTVTITAGRASRPAGAAPSIIRRCSGSPSSCSWRRSRFMCCPTTCRGGRNCADRRAVAATRRRRMWPTPACPRSGSGLGATGALQAIADRPLALGKAVERAQHDLAAVVDGIPAGLGDVVVADIVGVHVDRHQVLGFGHAASLGLQPRLVQQAGAGGVRPSPAPSVRARRARSRRCRSPTRCRDSSSPLRKPHRGGPDWRYGPRSSDSRRCRWRRQGPDSRG